MIVRREGPQDVVRVRSVVAAAFGGERDADLPVEVTLLDALREDEAWLPALSLVALDPVDPEGEIVVGHVVCTRGDVVGWPGLGLGLCLGLGLGLGLGPLAVRPDRWHRGVGEALMHAVLGAADALGEPFVALLGDPAYYGRFGFRTGSTVGIDPPEPAWGVHFQVRRLSAWTPVTGTFRYAAPFDRL